MNVALIMQKISKKIYNIAKKIFHNTQFLSRYMFIKSLIIPGYNSLNNDANICFT